MYLYLKALHIIFVVTWFAGLFYMPRLFIYNTEAGEKSPEVKQILQAQFTIMMKRLWYGITWPSAVITLIFGLSVLFHSDYKWYTVVFKEGGGWLTMKLGFVVFLYVYHISLHILFAQQVKGVFKYSSQQLRNWNEVATIFLVAIVMLVVVKDTLSPLWGIGGLILLIAVLLIAINIYKKIRRKSS